MAERTCSIEGCVKPYYARRWCYGHWRLWRTHGSPLYVAPRRTCSIDGCDEGVLARGWCSRHWQRWRNHGDPTWRSATVTNHYSLADKLTGRLTITALDRTEYFSFYDLADHDIVIAHKWHVQSGGYAASSAGYLHRILLGLSGGDRREVDHVNGDRLDNRRSNLRIATHRRNTQNQAIINGRGSSKYRGVTRFNRTGRWAAQTVIGGSRHHLGYFATEVEAADAVAAFRAERDVLAGYARRHPHTPIAPRRRVHQDPPGGAA